MSCISECQLNPTPGRCPLEEENTFWMYNTKLGVCVRITGCYDFHDRNVWSSEQRCQTKCNVGDMGTILPEIQPGIRIDAGIYVKSHVLFQNFWSSPGGAVNSIRNNILQKASC